MKQIKKNLGSLIALIFLSAQTIFAQTLNSITPTIGFPGQILSTTVSGSGIFVQGSSPSGNIYNIYLQQGAGFSFYFFDYNTLWQYNINVTDPNTVETFNSSIPAGAPLGSYDLHVTTGDVSAPWWNQQFYTLPNAFTVVPPDGIISGNIYLDANENGIKDPGEQPVANQKIRLMPNNIVLTSDISGNYSTGAFNGNYTVSWELTANKYMLLNSDSASYTVVINNNNSSVNDFGLIPAVHNMTPNQSYQGLNINAVITSHGIFSLGAQSNGNINSIQLYRPGQTIPISLTNTTVIDSNTVNVTFTVPGAAAIGNYELQMSTDSYVNYHILSNAFAVILFPAYVSGTVYYDFNTNGVKDVGEPGMNGQRVLLTPDSIYAYTDNNGNYSIGTMLGNHTIEWFPNAGSPFTLSSGPGSYNLNLTGNSSGNDFGILTTSPDYTAQITYTSGLPRCFQNVVYTLIYTNTGNIPSNGSVYLIKDPLMTYVSATVPPVTFSGDTIFWNFTNILPFIQNGINITFTMPGPNNTLHSVAVIEMKDAGNVVQFVDSAIINQTVLCSYDPNDKAVLPEGVFAPHYTLMNAELNYTIRFQNTGNDTAFNVVIYDYLDSDLDYATFNLVASSHNCQAALETYTGELTFTFDNILLPDSNVNEPGSNGFLRYSIRAKPGLPDYTDVLNTAYIVFDLNPPVVTNTTFNTMVYTIPTGIIEHVLQTGEAVVYPNPFDESATILFKNEFSETFHLQIVDARGRIVIEQYTDSDRYLISKGHLESGMYLFRLVNEENTNAYTGKFVIK